MFGVRGEELGKTPSNGLCNHALLSANTVTEVVFVMTHVLVTGASGYLGQFVSKHLRDNLPKDVGVVGTFSRETNSKLVPEGVEAIQVNLGTGVGIDDVRNACPRLAAIVNCAAISQPKACEDDEPAARALNVPEHVVTLANELGARLVHMSTDQVYDGTRANSNEDAPCAPVNAYGRSKLAAEEYITKNCNASKAVSLRSSIIYGPEPASPVGRTLFLQFVLKAVQGNEPFTFFGDEYRNPVYVKDICRIVESLVVAPEWPLSKPVYCMGGPERLSRADFARRVAAVAGSNGEMIEEVSASSVNRGVKSPADISMESKLLFSELGITPTAFVDGVKASI